MTPGNDTVSDELDVRDVPKPQRHPLIFDRFAALAPSGSFVLVNSHDPKHLRQEFDRDLPGSYGWDYVESGPTWRIRISKLTDANLPRILCNTDAVAASSPAADAGGAVWKLEAAQRHLDANLIRLQPDAQIARHAGPDLDVLMHVLAGTGELSTETGSLALEPGALIWLPRRSTRQITAGPGGLSYLTVHPRRPALSIDAAPAR